MLSRSETHVQADGARVEVGTIVFEGREFANLGSIVDEARGYIAGYVTEREGRYLLTTWEGATIAPLRLVRRFTSYGACRADMWAWSATIGGRVYSGRNGGFFGGPGCLVRMRAGATGRGRMRTADPFSADAKHLDRFRRQVEVQS